MHKLTVLAPMATAFIALLALAPSAWAVDGVIEINHAKALAGGVTASDTPGYPVTIDSAGSYRLTGNLTVPDENTDGVVVSANDVSIDLNGFSIVGPVACSGNPHTCTPAAGTGSGITKSPFNIFRTTVKAGGISGMGQFGVDLGPQSEVTRVRVFSSAVGGILTRDGSTISGSSVYLSGGVGIHTEPGSVVSGNSAYGNGAHGIVAGSGSTVSGNSVTGSGQIGIWASTGAVTVSGNTVEDNGLTGIKVAPGSTVSGNSVGQNGSHGIEADHGSHVADNSVRGNTGWGLYLGPMVGYRGNVISSNTAGTVTGGVNAGGNVCNGSTTCP